MEKLIELLNEFQKEKKGQIFYSYNRDLDFFESGAIAGCQIYGESVYTIISKKFGFIDWLVKNNKIDRDKTNIEKSDDKRYDEGIVLASNYDNDTYVVEKYYSYVEQLLMILSIQDNPIEYLCGILK